MPFPEQRVLLSCELLFFVDDGQSDFNFCSDSDNTAYMNAILFSEQQLNSAADIFQRDAAFFVFPSGVVLTIPDVEDKVNMQLPPWKRGIL